MESVRIAVHVLALLSPSRRICTAEIHEHLIALGFKRTRRSIQRLMEDLCASFDIECDDSSKPFGYRWKSNARGLGLPAVSDHESLVLMLAKQHLDMLLPASVMHAMKPLLDEARHRLDPYGGKSGLRSWPRKVAVVSQLQPLIPPKLASGVFKTVTEALYSDQWLDIDYRNFDGESRNNKRVQPLALVQQGVRLFLVCQFEGYDNLRHLALHRIRRARLSGLQFERPDFNLDAHIQNGRFGFGCGERICLCLEVDAGVADLLSETPVSGDQSIRRIDEDTFELTATVVRSEQLRWWLLTYGSSIRVISPEKLLEETGTAARPTC